MYSFSNSIHPMCLLVTVDRIHDDVKENLPPRLAPNTPPYIFYPPIRPPPLLLLLLLLLCSLSGWRRKAVPDVVTTFFFPGQSDIKTLLLWRGQERGGCVALHRLGGLFIEMEEEGRKNKYTTASKHLLCLPGCDVSK